MDRIALLERGQKAVSRGDLVAAAADWRAMLVLSPQDDVALTNLAAVLNASGCHAAAEAACRQALAAHPGQWAALGNLGTALHHQRRLDEAVAAYAASLRANPGNVDACTNLAVVLAEQWRMDPSLALHDVAVALAPDDPEIRCNRALALLASGDFPRGFAENEWRWRTKSMVPHGIAGPQWQGANPRGRIILLHEEGGFGDTLQFIRYAPLLAERGARVVVRVRRPLLRLLRRGLPGIRVVCDAEPLPHYDLQCPMGSLPLAFATTLETVPDAAPYLQLDARASAQARLRLDAALGPGGRRVGLVWAGAPRPLMPDAHAVDGRRSMPPALLAPLASVPGVRLVSLQHAPATPPPSALYDPMADMTDFADTAAVVAGLDLVIAVDTAVAHLAGALGRPVWLLSRYDACWRWLAHRSDSPWYPGLRLYRQGRPGDWPGVIDRVTRDLAAFA